MLALMELFESLHIFNSWYDCRQRERETPKNKSK